MENCGYRAISILIPTLNSSRTLKSCLDAIAAQDYPSELVEVILADGGSVDATLEIIEGFARENQRIVVKVVQNRLQTGEAGKAAALRQASNEIIASVDSDNILAGRDWLRRMIEPFEDAEIVAAEPVRYTYRREDGYITRYCAMLGMNDPLCYFLGNYDRECLLSSRWTSMPHQVVSDNGRYLKVRLCPGKMPTIGANGFLIRRSELRLLGTQDYLVDIDILSEILAKDPEKLIAKVNTGIVHVFAGGIRSFLIKQRRRISDYRQAVNSYGRSYDWRGMGFTRVLLFSICCIVVVPLLVQSLLGYARKRDPSWFMHPVFCIVTFWIYAYGVLVGHKVVDRSSWRA